MPPINDVLYGGVTVGRLCSCRRFTCALEVVGNGSEPYGGKAHGHVKVRGMGFGLSATWAGPLLARSDDLDPAFDDFRSNGLEPAD
jgi:hypothetical protein